MGRGRRFVRAGGRLVAGRGCEIDDSSTLDSDVRYILKQS